MYDESLIRLPHFLIEAGSLPQRTQEKAWATIVDRSIYITSSNYEPEPCFYEQDGTKACVLGWPVLDGVIAPQRVAKEACTRHGDLDWLRSLDSEFLIVILEDRRTLKVITSRFSSPPFWYYSHNGRFLGSCAYNDLWLRLHSLGLLEVTPESFYDLLLYKRIFGHKTHSRHTLLAPPASVLTFDGQGTSLERYWRPDFRNKNKMTIPECASTLAERIRQAIIKKTSDGVRPALFLSGGMDTRTLLSVFAKLGKPPTCFTINEFENREVQVARQLAATVGAKHIYLPFMESHYTKVLPPAFDIVGGMQLPMCMFLGFRDKVREHADVAFHGHGFDFFFQGMYIPAKNYNLFGRKLYYRKMAEPEGDPAHFFMKNISYRIKNPRCLDLIAPKYRNTLYEGLYQDINKISEEAAEITSNPFDLMEYLTFYNMPRHYTYGDHWSINANLPQRTISFDNGLYDLYQALKPEQRFDARTMRTCLKLLNPKMARIMSANTTVPVKASSLERTGYQLGRAALRKLRLQPPYKGDNDFQRMGLPLYHVLHGELRPYVEEMLTSDRLSTLYYLDMDEVKKYTTDFMDKPTDDGQLMMTLVTVDQFLKQLAP